MISSGISKSEKKLALYYSILYKAVKRVEFKRINYEFKIANFNEEIQTI